MNIHLTVDIETNQGLFKRVNTKPYDVPVTGGEWNPDAGVLLYPDRRARRMRVYAPGVEPGDKASGTIDITGGSGSNLSDPAHGIIDVASVTGTSGSFQVRIIIEGIQYDMPNSFGSGSTVSQVAADMVAFINSDPELSTEWIAEHRSSDGGITEDRVYFENLDDGVANNGIEYNAHMVNLSGDAAVTFSYPGGPAPVTEGGTNNEGTITVSIDTGLLSKNIHIVIPGGQPPGQIETLTMDGLNGDNDFSTYYEASGNNPVLIEALEPGTDYNGIITLDLSDAEASGTATDITGGSEQSQLGDDYQLVKTFDLSASKRSNYAFVLVDSIDLATFESSEILEMEGYNDANEVFDNRVKVSETNQPFLFEADKTYYPGKSSGDRIVAFAVNALPVSQGQFGQYPLYVLCSQSIWGLEQSQDPLIAFSRVSPVSMTHGLDHRRGVVNIGRQIIFMFEERLYPLDGSSDPEEISKPINGLLEGTEPLAYYSHDDVKELWVATADGVLAYNLEYRRWFSLNRDVQFFMNRGNELYGVEADGSIRNEYALTGGNVGVSFTLDPVHFGYPDTLKRIYALYVRAALAGDPPPELTLTMEGSSQSFTANKLFFRPRHRSAYSFVLQVEGTMDPGADHWIHQIEAMLDLRYTKRTRPTKLS